MSMKKRGTWYATPYGELVARSEQAGRPRLSVAETMARLMAARS